MSEKLSDLIDGLLGRDLPALREELEGLRLSRQQLDSQRDQQASTKATQDEENKRLLKLQADLAERETLVAARENSVRKVREDLSLARAQAKGARADEAKLQAKYDDLKKRYAASQNELGKARLAAPDIFGMDGLVRPRGREAQPAKEQPKPSTPALEGLAEAPSQALVGS